MVAEFIGIRHVAIHTKLREARTTAGYTLDQAAEKIGISIASLSRMETGVSKVSIQRMGQFAAFYGVSASALLGGEIVMRPTTIDLERMERVVEAVAGAVARLGVSPSPAKLGRAVSQVYQLEINRLVDHPDAEFDLTQHTKFIDVIFSE